MVQLLANIILNKKQRLLLPYFKCNLLNIEQAPQPDPSPTDLKSALLNLTKVRAPLNLRLLKHIDFNGSATQLSPRSRSLSEIRNKRTKSRHFA